MRFTLPLRTGLRKLSRERINSSSNSSLDVSPADEDEIWSQRPSVAVNRSQVDPYHNASYRKLHWLSPIMMIGCLVSGVAFAGGHHAYYSWLDGRVVEDSRRQQWALNIGNGFAIYINLLLKTAVGIAFTQYLWKQLRCLSISVSSINDAFGMGTNIFSFLNWELISNIPITAALGLLLWVLPIASLFAPATLSIRDSQVTTFEKMAVLNIGISDSSLSEYYDAPLARIINGVATTGIVGNVIPPRPASYANMSYEIQSYIPLLRCSEANSSVRSQILGTTKNAIGRESPFLVSSNLQESVSQNLQNDLKWSYDAAHGDIVIRYSGEIGYFSMIPVQRVPRGRNHSRVLSKTIWNSTELAYLKYATLGEIWIGYANYFGSSSNAPHAQRRVDYITCGLQNASVALGIAFTNHAASITVKNVTYISRETTNKPFSRFFKFVAVNLIKPSAYSTRSSTHSSHQYRELVQSNIMMTSLALLEQVKIMDKTMKHHEKLKDLENLHKFDDAPNISLSEAIEGFSLNSSLSLLSNPDLCNSEIANVTIRSTKTVYNYEPRFLFISYGLAILSSTIAVLLGSFAFSRNGVSHDTSVSSIATAMRNPEVQELLRKYPSGVQPLNKELGSVKLRFQMSHGFVLETEKEEDTVGTFREG
ncbi:hypothetical protein HYFRA_00011335 [Hymenoscyphus fraxineus]|uniref:Uncharacterized protein n=1 Tax=Hymenoscyphus fraxineus TaxID=746836 RepID=A0A9N9KYF5_9HELO|nr:hypothetical protein HYFRA_00011335 [Hymenoscyphus fraxineus]